MNLDTIEIESINVRNTDYRYFYMTTKRISLMLFSFLYFFTSYLGSCCILGVIKKLINSFAKYVETNKSTQYVLLKQITYGM